MKDKIVTPFEEHPQFKISYKKGIQKDQLLGNNDIIKGIPTIGPHGIEFRSQLEAQWAEFFDLLGWEWEYEPYPLNGYIPDFILNFKEELLVEVKSELKLENLYKYQEKIWDSGWKNKFLIVGAKLFNENDDSFYGSPIIGTLGSGNLLDWYNEGKKSIKSFEDYKIFELSGMDNARLISCEECEGFSITEECGSWSCYKCGKGFGKYIWHNFNESLVNKVRLYWFTAKNKYQYQRNKKRRIWNE